MRRGGHASHARRDHFAAGWAERRAMPLEQAIAYALEDDTLIG